MHETEVKWSSYLEKYGLHMEAVHSKRFVKELVYRIDEREPVAVVHNDKVVGCYIPCEEEVDIRGFPVIDSFGATRAYLPLENQKMIDVLKMLRYIEI